MEIYLTKDGEVLATVFDQGVDVNASLLFRNSLPFNALGSIFRNYPEVTISIAGNGYDVVIRSSDRYCADGAMDTTEWGGLDV